MIRLSTLTETESKNKVKTGALRVSHCLLVGMKRSKQVPSEYHFTPKVRSENGSVVDKIPHQIKLEFHKQTVCVVDAFAEKCFIKH